MLFQHFAKHHILDESGSEKYLSNMLVGELQDSWCYQFQHVIGFQINIPSLNEQKRIVAKIESIFAEIDAIEQYVKSTLQLLDQLKNSTLKQAFEGKLVPQDPNDEPAEFILQKIKQENSLMRNSPDATP